MQGEPVHLTARQQNMLAELCENMASVTYKFWTSAEAESKLDVTNFMLRWNPTGQEFGKLYDVMHRTGANQWREHERSHE